MSTAVCPYCRGPISPETEGVVVCAGCGTSHHNDCYAENGGCTVFGCSAAPAEEPKLSVSGSDLARANAGGMSVSAAPASVIRHSSILGWDAMQGSPAAPEPAVVRVKAAPPPMPAGASTPVAPAAPVVASSFGAGSVLFPAQPAPIIAPTTTSSQDLNFEPHPDAKNRTTFIVLGVLLGPLGAHNFYAGFKKKAAAQLCITLLTLGFASPMSWIWAVIDVCTVDQDSTGIKFRS